VLPEAKVGCYIGGILVGAVAHADDLVLTTPSANALRKMLAIYDAYAFEYFMNFYAQKSKCMIVLPSSRRLLAPLLSQCAFKIGVVLANGNCFILLPSWAYHCSSFSDEQDILRRRNTFIGQVSSVLFFFGKLPSALL